jgi:hypothetical protein
MRQRSGKKKGTQKFEWRWSEIDVEYITNRPMPHWTPLGVTYYGGSSPEKTTEHIQEAFCSMAFGIALYGNGKELAIICVSALRFKQPPVQSAHMYHQSTDV